MQAGWAHARRGGLWPAWLPLGEAHACSPPRRLPRGNTPLLRSGQAPPPLCHASAQIFPGSSTSTPTRKAEPGQQQGGRAAHIGVEEVVGSCQEGEVLADVEPAAPALPIPHRLPGACGNGAFEGTVRRGRRQRVGERWSARAHVWVQELLRSAAATKDMRATPSSPPPSPRRRSLSAALSTHSSSACTSCIEQGWTQGAGQRLPALPCSKPRSLTLWHCLAGWRAPGHGLAVYGPQPPRHCRLPAPAAAAAAPSQCWGTHRWDLCGVKVGPRAPGEPLGVVHAGRQVSYGEGAAAGQPATPRGRR